MAGSENNDRGQPGIGVDARGGGVVDPTKNVLDLVRAESTYQNAMRDAQEKLLNEKVGGLAAQVKLISDSVVMFQNAQREAETKRIDQLAENRQEFQNTIRDMLAESVRTTSSLVSTQLVQIQATFDTRVTKLEAYQLTQAGRSSIADPAMSDYMAKASRDMAALTQTTSDALTKMASAITAIGTVESQNKGRGMGRGEVFAWLCAAVVAGGTIASLIGALVRLATHS